MTFLHYIDMANIFTPQCIADYTKTRLSGKNIPLDMVKIIGLYNGSKCADIEHMLKKRSVNFERVEQEKGREPIYYANGELLISQFSGRGREQRYRRMIEEFISVCGPDIEFNVHEKGGKRRETLNAYENYAYDFFAGMFLPKEHHEAQRVFPSYKVDEDITNVIFGPLDVVEKHPGVRVIEKGNSDYLDSQIIELNGRLAVNIAYVYSDQAGLLVSYMVKEYEGIAYDRGYNKLKPLDIVILMFGRVGGLKKDMKRHDVVCPQGVLDHTNLYDRKLPIRYMDNIAMTPGKADGLILNVESVFDETVEMLEDAKSKGCVCVEMETWEVLRALDFVTRHQPSTRIHFGFAGHVSDNPLQSNANDPSKRDTLATELDSDEGAHYALENLTKGMFP